MPTVINYAENFERQIFDMYAEQLKTTDLTSQDVRFLDAQTVKVPQLSVSGYKDHSRNGGFNQGTVQNTYQTLVLDHDRDIKFMVDVMDVDETKQVLAAANVTATFLSQQAIPETDKYRLSKIYADFVTNGGTPDTTVPTAANILSLLDSAGTAMDEAEVPQEGRILYCTPQMFAMLKQAPDIERFLMIDHAQSIDRNVIYFDNMKIIKVPSARMQTVYDFSNGAVAGASAQTMNFIMLHPSAVIAVIKHSKIELREPSMQTEVDGYLYINRSYQGCFVIESRKNGVMINTGVIA